MSDAEQILRGLDAHQAVTAHAEQAVRLAWDEPVPLGVRGQLPAFPANVFPAWVAEMVLGVAEETQTPVDAAGSVALAALSTIAGGRAIVVVQGRLWTEPVNIFTVVALPPGSRKSAVFRAMTAPLQAAQKELQARIEPQIKEAELARSVAQKAAERAAQAAGAAGPGAKPDSIVEATDAAMAVEAIQIPVRPRLIADDVTPETAATLMAEQGGRLAVLSAEGGIFATLAGRYSGVPNLDLFLKGHAGDTLIVDRRGRSEYIEDAALTLGLAVQPDVIAEIATMPGFRGKGLLGRILYALPPSNIGYRDLEPEPIPAEVIERYDQNLRTLLATMYGWQDPARITFSPEAGEVFLEHRRTTEPRLRAHGGDLGHMTDWGSKYDGAIARMAGLIHLATDVKNAWRHPISADTIRAAIRLGEFYAAHAMAAFDVMGADPDLEGARTVFDWLTRTKPAEFTRRTAHRALQRKFKKSADLEPALTLLEEHGWIRPRPDPYAVPKAQTIYLIHPTLQAPDAQATKHAAGPC